MRRRILGDNKILKGTIVESDFKVGNLVLYDKTLGKKIVIDLDQPSQEFPFSAYHPLAVITIPSSHDVYGTGEAGAMSLMTMNCATPADGAVSNQYMYWGVYGTDITTLTNFNVANTINDDGSLKGTANYPYLPSDKFTGTQSPDPEAKYYSTSISGKAPSPYDDDGISRNPNYHSIEKSAQNALSDFDGRGNTDKILAQRGPKDYTTWKPTHNTAADYPAASCCDMFHPEGTTQGEWYLPACGELGYIMPRWNVIKRAIQAVIDAGADSLAVLLGESNAYWSSSECSSNFARFVGTSRGSVDGYSKNYDFYVRAWLRVGASEEK